MPQTWPGIWRVVETGAGSPAWNMAVDEALLESHAAGRVPPTLRLYRWLPAGFTLGYSQNPEKVLDLDRCRAAGIGWVRRLTGGRAVLHEGEVTYSLVVQQNLLPGSILATYRTLAEGLLMALGGLGLEARLSPGKPGWGERSAACFDAPSWYELTIAGRKVVGSAQARRQGVILQHGSIPLKFDARRVVGLLRFRSEEAREGLAKTLIRTAAGLDNFLPEPPDFQQVTAAIKKGFEQALAISLQADKLLPEEVRLANRLVREKYQRAAWNGRAVRVEGRTGIQPQGRRSGDLQPPGGRGTPSGGDPRTDCI